MNSNQQRLLHDSLVVSAAKHPDKTALVIEGISYTYGQLLASASALAGRLLAAKLKRGDWVAVYMDNTWPCVISIFGTLMAGGAFIIINPQTKSDKLAYILNDSGAGILLADSHLAKAYGPALKETPAIRLLIASGKILESDFEIAAEPFDVALQSPPSAPVPEVIPLDLAALIYTSGSTGNPKGVMMSHQNMTFTVGSLIEYLRLGHEDRILNVLPLAFGYGLFQLLMTIKLGAVLVLERSFAYPAQVLNRMSSEGITVFPAVPTIYMTLIGMHNRVPLSFPTVRGITNAAAALPSEIVPRLAEIFPNASLFRMYGLTECMRVCYLEPELVATKPESVGKAIPGTEVFLLGEDGKPAGPGETGTLYVRGPHVMLGYWNNPEQSAHMLKPGRYPGERVLCTQDHFKMDAEGFLFFQGRSDDIIKSRGEKVSPIAVENCLYGITGIREAAVIGVPDALMGEAIRAYVALEIGCVLSEKEIRGICLAKLESFMVPKEVVILPELPKTATGKIRKKDLKTLELA